MTMVCSQCKRPVEACGCSIDPAIVADIPIGKVPALEDHERRALIDALKSRPVGPILDAVEIRWFITYRVKVWNQGGWSTREEKNTVTDRHPLAWLANGAPEGTVILWWTEVPKAIADALWR